MDVTEIIESYSSSLVREYLYRKGLKITLTTLDSECPRNSQSINSSSVLARHLRLENIIKKNRQSKTPYSSILEVLVHYIKKGREFYRNEKLKARRHNPPTLLTLSNLKSLHNQLNERGDDIDFLSLIKLYCGCCGQNTSEERKPHDQLPEGCPTSCGKQNDIKRDENGEATLEFDEKFYYTQREPQSYAQKETSTLTEKENVLKSYMMGDSSQDMEGEESEVSLEYCSGGFRGSSSPSESSTQVSSKSPKKVLNSNRSTSHSPNCTNTYEMKNKTNNATDGESLVSIRVPNIVLNGDDLNIIDNESYSNEETAKSSPFTTRKLPDSSDEEDMSSTSITNIKSTVDFNRTSDINSSNIENNKIINIDCDNQSKEHLSEHLLKKILYANNKQVSDKWLGEGFIFDKAPTSYGLIQTKEGSSGVLAAVNAYVIKELLFRDIKNDIEFLRPNNSQLEPALIEAMEQILWQAGGNRVVLANLQNGLTEISTVEDVINNSTYETFTTKTDLHKSLKDNIDVFVRPGSHGCILFLISTILSRGVEKVIEDMNGAPTLINSNGFSTLELVNLLLSGSAVSNVFDNHIKLQFSTIRGIPKRSDIGYLSIKEHFKCCKVGSYLKTPRFPIWLVHNENQFTILFSCQKQLLSDWKVERKFVMTYYDPLKHLGDEIRLAIDTTLGDDANNTRDNIKAIVENCVRTKWKDANITWK